MLIRTWKYFCLLVLLFYGLGALSILLFAGTTGKWAFFIRDWKLNCHDLRPCYYHVSALPWGRGLSSLLFVYSFMLSFQRLGTGVVVSVAGLGHLLSRVL
jgi:hypothetical protein